MKLSIVRWNAAAPLVIVEGGELGRWCELGQNLATRHLCYCSLRDTGVQWDENVVHCDPCDCVLLLI